MIRSNSVNFFNLIRESGSFVGDQLDEFMWGRFTSQKREFIPYCSSPSYDHSGGNLQWKHNIKLIGNKWKIGCQLIGSQEFPRWDQALCSYIISKQGTPKETCRLHQRSLLPPADMRIPGIASKPAFLTPEFPLAHRRHWWTYHFDGLPTRSGLDWKIYEEENSREISRTWQLQVTEHWEASR